ncbi:MAG: acyl carrier protein [Weeping tea tree witches'-broom phytoplasma]|uniref:acyl carrier protein n=1 Tax=Candidatus Phytoplasma melaleucae TaxID=2982630 RepID=UPI00293A67F2|nr:acyl carrier protein [Weeping tea tree witches'-broom phytoplasma]
MILTKIRKIIARKLSISEDQIALQTKLKDDLCIDSIDAVDLVIELEQVFKIKISDEALQQFKTVQDMVDHIKCSLYNS